MELIGPKLKEWLVRHRSFYPRRARRESNRWLRRAAAGIEGRVLSVGSGNDSDAQCHYYREYFKSCSSYTTSEVSPDFGTDLVLDLRSMPQIADGAYDCVFCSGVLEHIAEYQSALNEITRILKPGGTLLLGLPFRQALHMAPQDFWRFTEFGIRHMLSGAYVILELAAMDRRVRGFPSAYWVKAQKR